MRVYLGYANTLYVDRERGAPLDVAQDQLGLGVYAAWSLPEDAVELHTADGAVSEVLDRVRHALSSVKMSATARREVERALDDLEPAES